MLGACSVSGVKRAPPNADLSLVQAAPGCRLQILPAPGMWFSLVRTGSHFPERLFAPYWEVWRFAASISFLLSSIFADSRRFVRNSLIRCWRIWFVSCTR
jgi:hypothetical protein